MDTMEENKITSAENTEEILTDYCNVVSYYTDTTDVDSLYSTFELVESDHPVINPIIVRVIKAIDDEILLGETTIKKDRTGSFDVFVITIAGINLDGILIPHVVIHCLRKIFKNIKKTDEMNKSTLIHLSIEDEYESLFGNIQQDLAYMVHDLAYQICGSRFITLSPVCHKDVIRDDMTGLSKKSKKKKSKNKKKKK